MFKPWEEESWVLRMRVVGLGFKLGLEWVWNQHVVHSKYSRKLGVSMVGKPKRIGIQGCTSEWKRESRE